MPDDTLVSAENNISFGQLIAHWAKNPQEIPVKETFFVGDVS